MGCGPRQRYVQHALTVRHFKNGREIVGVVGDVAQSFEAGAKAEYFLPYAQYPHSVLVGLYRNVALVTRVAGDPTDIYILRK